MRKFSISQTHAIREYYNANGYVVIEKALPDTEIDRFLQAYESAKRNSLFVYYSQTIHRCIRPSLTSEGFIKESIESPSRLRLFPKFASSLQKCLLHEAVSDSLSAVSGQEQHVLWQNMFFDFSPGTVEHQDHWYLDTDPAGHLIGAWYALEDIHEDSGCFFVLPGSHKSKPLEMSHYNSHEEVLTACMKLIEKEGYSYQKLLFNKGDLMLWHPYTIHGAFGNTDPKRSRKSLTAHFYPKGMKKANRVKQPKLKATLNPKVLNSFEGSDFVWHFKKYGRYLVEHLTGNTQPVMDMKREAYNSLKADSQREKVSQR